LESIGGDAYEFKIQNPKSKIQNPKSKNLFTLGGKQSETKQMGTCTLTRRGVFAAGVRSRGAYGNSGAACGHRHAGGSTRD
jgi:hypothetical protein